MRTLILGASGRLGSKLFWEAGWRGHRVAGTRFRSANRVLFRLDLRDGPSVNDLIVTSRPDVVFMAAGISDAGVAEAHPQGCLSVNCDGAIHVAQAVRSTFGDEDFPKPRLVFFSGDPASEVLNRAEAMAEEALRLIAPEQHLITRVGRDVKPAELAERAMDLVENGSVGTCQVAKLEAPLLSKAA